MHVLATELATLEEADVAVDLGQSPADIVVLSFSDSDLSALAAAWRREADLLPTMRLASLKRLKHPMSVDLYVESVVARARLVIVRCLGGLDYWRYGLEHIADTARERSILCHTDAAQTAGKIPVDAESLGVDLLSIAGHKLYAPKGVGVLFVREGVEVASLLHGANHEAGRRAGTENVAAIVGLGAACELAMRWIETSDATSLRDYFWQRLRGAFGVLVVLNGHPNKRLPNTLNVSFAGFVGSDILAKLPEVAASTGSACHAGVHCLSPVLEAMGVEESIGVGAIRFSLGRTTTASEIDFVIQKLEEVIGKLERAVGENLLANRS
jgi:hypothetical protein